MTDNVFVDLMSTSITSTDGTESEALTMFELQLLEKNDARLVWELFEPVRGLQLRRLYRMAQHKIEQASEAQPIPQAQPGLTPGTVSEPDEATDSSAQASPTQAGPQHSVVSPATERKPVALPAQSHSPRSATSARGLIMNAGSKQGQFDRFTDHYGTPVRILTAPGVSNCLDENPMYVQWMQVMWEVTPKSGRASDTVGKFTTPDESTKYWNDIVKRFYGPGDGA